MFNLHKTGRSPTPDYGFFQTSPRSTPRPVAFSCRFWYYTTNTHRLPNPHPLCYSHMYFSIKTFVCTQLIMPRRNHTADMMLQLKPTHWEDYGTEYQEHKPPLLQPLRWLLHTESSCKGDYSIHSKCCTLDICCLSIWKGTKTFPHCCLLFCYCLYSATCMRTAT